MGLLSLPHNFSQRLTGLFLIVLGLHVEQWWPLLGFLEHLGQRLWRIIEPSGCRVLPVNNGPGVFSRVYLGRVNVWDIDFTVHDREPLARRWGHAGFWDGHVAGVVGFKHPDARGRV